MSRLPRTATTVPLALLLLLAGCGDDKKGSAGDPAPSTSQSSSPPLNEAAAAAAINLKAADLGPGWTGSAPDPDSSAQDEEVEKSIYACLKETSPDPAGDDIPSEDFTDADEAEISSSVDFYSSAAVAKSDFQLVTSEKALACVRTAFQTLLTNEVAGSGGTVSNVSIVRRKPLEVLPGSAAFRITATLTVQGQSVTFTGDVITFVRGRAGVTVTTLATGTPVADAILLAASKAVATRAEAVRV